MNTGTDALGRRRRSPEAARGRETLPGRHGGLSGARAHTRIADPLPLSNVPRRTNRLKQCSRPPREFCGASGWRSGHYPTERHIAVPEARSATSRLLDTDARPQAGRAQSRPRRRVGGRREPGRQVRQMCLPPQRRLRRRPVSGAGAFGQALRHRQRVLRGRRVHHAARRLVRRILRIGHRQHLLFRARPWRCCARAAPWWPGR